MKVFVVAGELSGDRLGGALMAGLRQLVPDVSFEGVGGPQMQAQGLQSLFPMDELSVMGLAEILPKYVALRRRMRETSEAVIRAQPDVLITIDSPEFCLRVAREVKSRADIRTVHYVAPSVWAWRPGRARKMARFIDHVLALLPFEPPYMRAEGMMCDFVGHPVVSEPKADAADIARLRAMFDLGEAPVLLMLPGSRRGEVEKLMPVFGDVVKRVSDARPDLRLVLPAATEPVAAMVREKGQKWSVSPDILDPGVMPREDFITLKRAAFATATGALAASGTVSLELAAAGTPMVIAYDMNPLSRWVLSRMLRIDTVTLVNLVSDTRAVPEFIGADCRPERIAPAVLDMLNSPSWQMDAMALTMERLGSHGEPPGLRAARAVLAGIESS